MSQPPPACRPPSGFTLVELLLVVAALAILLAALAPGAGVLDTARAGRTRQELDTLRTAAERWLERGHTDYASVSLAALKSEGLLPAGWTGETAWGGTYTIGPDTDVTKLAVTATGLPDAVATRLAAQLAAAGWTTAVNGGTLTASW